MCRFFLFRTGFRKALAVLNLAPSFVVVCMCVNPWLVSATCLSLSDSLIQ